MKQQILKNYEELSENERKKLICAIAGFFFYHPFNETKNTLWTFYKTWVCNAAKVAEPSSHEDNMLFYDNIIEFFKDCHNQLKIDDSKKLKL